MRYCGQETGTRLARRASKRVVVWDFDGTLAHRPGAWSGALIEALHQENQGVQFTIRDVQSHLRTGFPWHPPRAVREPPLDAGAWWAALTPVFVRAFVALGIEREPADRAASRVREIYTDPSSWRSAEDAIWTLQSLSRSGWTQTILSNHVPELSDLAAALGLMQYCDAVFSSASIGFEKPDRRAFQTVLRAYSNADIVVMVGDNLEADVYGAQAAGMHALLVGKADSSVDLVPNLREAVARIEQIGSASATKAISEPRSQTDA